MKWLFLVHQVQTPNSRERVRVWRSIKKIGAILYRNTVYVLPYNAERLEDIQWLCQQIRDSRGEASVFVSEADSPEENKHLQRIFINARQIERVRITKLGEQLLERVKKARSAPSPSGTLLKRLRKEFQKLHAAQEQLTRINFFPEKSSKAIPRLMADIAALLDAIPIDTPPTMPVRHYALKQFQNKVWATRKHIHIDRLASAWLIRRFIDPKAKFIFAPEENLPKSAVLFDVFGAEFSHGGDRCTFETLLQVFHIQDKALWSLAELVHEIDLKDDKYKRPESPGLDLIVRSLSDSLPNDHKTLEMGSRVLDAIYERFAHHHE